MHDIICPHCHKAFKIDEAGYADILKQVRDAAFEQQLHELARDGLAERRRHVEVEPAEAFGVIALFAHARGDLRPRAARVLRVGSAQRRSLVVEVSCGTTPGCGMPGGTLLRGGYGLIGRPSESRCTPGPPGPKRGSSTITMLSIKALITRGITLTLIRAGGRGGSILRRSFADYIWRYLMRAAEPYGFDIALLTSDGAT